MSGRLGGGGGVQDLPGFSETGMKFVKTQYRKFPYCDPFVCVFCFVLFVCLFVLF